MDNKRPIDVRIIVEGASDVESVSKAMQNVALGAEYHITISSIIPTTSSDIAKRAVKGADLVLIATDVDGPGRELADKFQKLLIDEVGHVERMKFPFGHDVEYIDPSLIRDEIKNAIIRAGLTSITNISKMKKLEDNIIDLKEKLNNIYDENSVLQSENHELSVNSKEIQKLNEELTEELDILREKSDNIEQKYNKLNDEIEKIRTKPLFELFNLVDLWDETFGSELKDEDQIYYATNQFRPDKIIVGQGHIGAVSKEKAIEWLKIVRTALIFYDAKEDNSENDSTHDSGYKHIWES
ncbi:MAG: toprim domain-containing protein [Methanobacteriaceae archaeon]|nr:toprim domain-containing protein [Methanobacteriaceae archaeon]